MMSASEGVGGSWWKSGCSKGVLNVDKKGRGQKSNIFLDIIKAST